MQVQLCYVAIVFMTKTIVRNANKAIHTVAAGI